MRVTGLVQRRTLARALPALALLVTGVATVPAASAAGATSSSHGAVYRTTTYRNPVSKSFADTYADPDVVRGKDGWWYAYATSDPLRQGGPRHLIPMSKSRDLVHWQFAGDAFTTLPSWADTTTPNHMASMWAPDVHYAGHGQWRMYYVVTETKGTGVAPTEEVNDNAIGMATAPSPLGPWTDSGHAVVGPRRAGVDNYFWTFDPEWVRDTDGSEHLFYGSFYGGVFEQTLNRAGTKVKGDETRIGIDNKFEGTYITRKDGYWYFFGSVAGCCNGPTTGYSVEVARSRNLTGPYVDKDGLRIDVGGNTGGTPVLYQNGNRWVGTGHNSMATDDRGQRWIVYHAIDRDNPYLDPATNLNRRPMLIDRIDWVHGWPVVRYGCGPSESVQRGPVVKTAGKVSTTSGRGYFDCLEALASVGPGRLDRAASDDFNGGTLGAGWETVRNPDVTVAGGSLQWPVENTDLVGTGPGKNTAGLLLRPAPSGNWTVQTKVTLDLGKDEVRNYQQAGLMAYVNDDLFTRLAKVAIWNTRQIEFGKEMPFGSLLPYGGTIIGPPALTTWLRIVHRTNPHTGEHVLTAFSSRDGRTWTRGGAWTLPKGSQIKIGLEAMGGTPGDPDVTASFDYFHVYRP